jgi:hypothetical protein
MLAIFVGFSLFRCSAMVEPKAYTISTLQGAQNDVHVQEVKPSIFYTSLCAALFDHSTRSGRCRQATPPSGHLPHFSIVADRAE